MSVMETRRFILAFTILLFNLMTAIGEDESSKGEFGIKNPSEEYVNVFQNIPHLFEYLLETLEEKPEILEKNDVTIFKRSIYYEKDETNHHNTKDEAVATTTSEIDIDSLADEDTAYIGLTDCKMFRLTSEEVAEQTLKVEQILDEHNNSN